MDEKTSRRIFFIAALVIMCGLILALVLSFFSDDEPPDVSDLVVEHAKIADDANGLPLLNGIYKLVKLDYGLSEFIRQTNWDQSKVDAMLAQNSTAFEVLDKVIARPGFQWEDKPGLRDAGGMNYQDLYTLKKLGDIKILSALNHWRNKQHELAIREDLQVLEFGRRLEMGGGLLFHCRYGVAIENDALITLCFFVNEMNVGERPEWESVFAEVKQDVDHVAIFRDAMKVEAVYSRGIFADIASGKMTISGYYSGRPLGPIYKRAFLQPNLTARMFVEAARQIIAEAPLPYSRIDPEPGAVKSIRKMSNLEQLLSINNFLGRMMFSDRCSYYSYGNARKYSVCVYERMTQTLIAVRLYWMDHGKLPDKLDDLVPEYLKSAPIDPYDGNPLRYSPAKKVIYSVGTSLTDSGGDPSGSNPDNDTQPTVKIGW